LKCTNCKLDLSADNKFLKGIGKEGNKESLVGWLVSVICPHCRIYQLIPIAIYYNFCNERLKLLNNEVKNK